MVGTRNQWQPFYIKERPLLSDLIVSGEDNIDQLYPGHSYRSTLIPGAYESEDFPNIGASGHWLHFTAAPLRDAEGNIVGAIETLRDVTERRVAENALRKAKDSPSTSSKSTAQLGAGEKMASIGRGGRRGARDQQPDRLHLLQRRHCRTTSTSCSRWTPTRAETSIAQPAVTARPARHARAHRPRLPATTFRP
jgi:hypothetical protein